MSRPRLLDLFCGAGGASMGYWLAGFDVVGVDIEPQPHYPFEFIQADALDFVDWIHAACSPTCRDGYHAIHASPPCHDHSTVTGKDRKRNGYKGTGWVLGATIDRLRASGLPWVVENVEAAVMPDPKIRLCGSSFGLDLRRHRWFASNLDLPPLPCDHSWQTPRFRSLAIANVRAGKLASVVGVHGHCNYAGEGEIRERAMRINWMTQEELTQAIPPAYTEYIGRQLKQSLDGTSGSN